MDKLSDAYWMPFTANRQFKKNPRLLARASGMHYWDDQGREILDGVAGLWCVNAGHGRPKITAAIQAQAAEMDFAPPFQMAHPKAFELAGRVAALAPQAARMNKQTLRALMPNPAIDHASADPYAYAASAEHQEGVQAFLAKRPPNF